jgi:hypothetical protein
LALNSLLDYDFPSWFTFEGLYECYFHILCSIRIHSALRVLPGSVQICQTGLEGRSLPFVTLGLDCRLEFRSFVCVFLVTSTPGNFARLL